MSRSAPLRLPVPPWAARLSGGLVARDVVATAGSVRLEFASSGGAVAIELARAAGQVATRIVGEGPHASRGGPLARALASQILSPGGPAAAWAVRAMDVAASDGDPLRRAVAALDEDRPEEALATLEAGEASGHDVAIRASGVLLRFAAGDVAGALERFAVSERLLSDSDNHAAALAVAVARAHTGEREAARGSARRLADGAGSHAARRVAARLLIELGDPELAMRTLGAASDLAIDEGDLLDIASAALLANQRSTAVFAARCLASGEFAGGPGPGAPEDGRRKLKAAEILIEAGTFAEALEMLESIDDAAVTARARAKRAMLALWRLDLEGARRLAAPLVQEGAADDGVLVTLGATALLAGDGPGAVAALEAVAGRQPKDVAVQLWWARALMAVGRLDEAGRVLHKGPFPDHPARHLLIEQLEALRDPSGKYPPPEPGRHFSVLIDVLGPGVADSFGSVSATRGAVAMALERFGGNLSPRSTFVDDGGALVAASNLRTARDRAIALQYRVLREPLPDVLVAFASHCDRFSETPFFETYAAELLLWVGDYEGALERFDALWRRHKTRWSYVGSGAALALLGRHEAALARWAEGHETHHGHLPQEATYAYRGEIWRKLGELSRAGTDLEGAVRASPTRLGAWVQLGLLRCAQEDTDGARAALARATALAPGLLYTAHLEAAARAASAGAARTDAHGVLDAAACMLRGNRSSSIFTFFPREGRMRVVTPSMAEQGRTLARHGLVLAREALLEALLGENNATRGAG